MSRHYERIHSYRKSALIVLPQIRFENVDVVAPGGTCCVSGLTFEVEPKKPLIITGPNGAGKSSVFRVLGGLWEIPNEGRVFRPIAGIDQDALSESNKESGAVARTRKTGDIPVFLVPQKPYHSNGSLADQVTYPHHIPKAERTVELEQKLLELLQLVEVDNLVERWSWHDARVVERLPVSKVCYSSLQC